jgi:hypothetical protein
MARVRLRPSDDRGDPIARRPTEETTIQLDLVQAMRRRWPSPERPTSKWPIAMPDPQALERAEDIEGREGVLQVRPFVDLQPGDAPTKPGRANPPSIAATSVGRSEAGR